MFLLLLLLCELAMFLAISLMVLWGGAALLPFAGWMGGQPTSRPVTTTVFNWRFTAVLMVLA